MIRNRLQKCEDEANYLGVKHKHYFSVYTICSIRKCIKNWFIHTYYRRDIVKPVTDHFQSILHTAATIFVGAPPTPGVGSVRMELTTVTNLQPYFDFDVQRNVTVTVGQTAFLPCHVERLGDKDVSIVGLSFVFITNTICWFLLVGAGINSERWERLINEPPQSSWGIATGLVTAILGARNLIYSLRTEIIAYLLLFRTLSFVAYFRFYCGMSL